MDSPEIGLLQPEEESKLPALFALAFEKELNPAKWRWKYHENPHGEGVQMAARVGKTLIGFYGLVPRRCRIGEQVAIIYQETDLMVHPEWRGKKIFQSIGSAAYDCVRQQGCPFTFGFPNDVSTPRGVKILGWVLVCPMPIWNRYERIGYVLQRYHWPLPSKPTDRIWSLFAGSRRQLQKRKTHCEVKITDSIDRAAMDDFWEHIKARHPVCFVRDGSYIAWRYRQWPDAVYRMISLWRRDELHAFAVIRIFDGSPRQGWVLELLAREDEASSADLFREIIEECSREEVDVIRLWLLDDNHSSRLMKSWRFRLRPTSIHHVIRPLQDDRIKNIVLDPHKWFVTIGDSDSL